MLFVLACALAAALAYRLGRTSLLAASVTDRSSHRRPVSQAGGLAVLPVAAFLVAVTGQAEASAFPLLASLLAFVLGLLDDARDLPGLPKLLALGALAVLVGSQSPLAAMPVPGLGLVGLAPLPGAVLAAILVLSLVNVVNFLDGLNGMAAGTVAVLLGLAAVLTGESLFALTASALLGFGVVNVAFGRPFLGDSGSLSIGTLAACGVLIAGGGEGAGPWRAALPAVPFVADAAVTLVRRARRGARLMQGHREHAYQRLAAAGLPHTAVSGAYAGLAALLAVAALAAGPGASATVLLAIYAFGFAAWAGLVASLWRLAPQPERATEASARIRRPA